MSKQAISKERFSSKISLSPLASALAFALVLPMNLHAGNFVISSQDDLDDAVDAINNNGNGNHTVTFTSDVSGSSLALGYIDLYDGGKLSIDGSGAEDVSLDMVIHFYSGRVIDVRNDSELSISDITLNISRYDDESAPYWDAEGVLVRNDATFNVSNVTVNLDGSAGFAGFVYQEDTYATTIVRDSHIKGSGDNTYGTQAFFIAGGNLQVHDSLLEKMYSYKGAAYLEAYDERIEATISGTTFKNNTSIYGSNAYSAGAALTLVGDDNGLVFSIDSSVITGGFNEWGSAGIFVGTDGSYVEGVISNTTIYKNHSNKYWGSAVLVNGSSSDIELAIVNTTITENIGGVSAINVNDSNYSSAVSLVLSHVTVANNSGEENVEVGSDESSAAVRLDLDYSYSRALISNSIIANNDRVYYDSENEEFVTIDSDILIESSNGDTLITNSLIGVEELSGEDSMIEGSANLIGVDPLLGNFGNHGGATPTIALTAGSPAIDAADLLTVQKYAGEQDQNGNSRLADGSPDMGAVEYCVEGACEEAASEIPGTIEELKKKSGGLFGSFGVEFLTAVFAFSWFRRKLK